MNNDYEGITSKTNQIQKKINESYTDDLIAANIKQEFNKWFEVNIEFGFGMRWIKPIAKKFCWHGYFAGYKSKGEQ